MHTISMHARQVSRWRWLATGLLIILLQAFAAIVVRGLAARESHQTPSAGATHDGRRISSGRGVMP